jgi:hypothetical protein
MAKFTIMKRVDGDALEHLPELLESVASIVGDGDLSQDEREAMLQQTFAAYADVTGRDGLSDIASTRSSKAEKGIEQMDNDNMDRGAVAMIALEGAAVALQKEQPNLTKEQAFAKVYSDPRYSEAMKAERQASRARLVNRYTPAVEREEASRSGTRRERVDPKILDDLSDEEVKRLIAEQRREHPFETPEQLYSRVYNSPAMVADRSALRRAEASARRETTDRVSRARLDLGNSLEVAKRARDEAHDVIAAAAAELRKVMPTLTFEQAYAKAYSDPANREIAKAERTASRSALFA